MTVRDYMNELVFYGGMEVPRGYVVEDLQSRGASPEAVGLYLFGLDRATERLRRTND